MKEFPIVFLLIPSYNHAKYLEGLFQSILEQDYPVDRIWLILSDDGSTDETHEILDKWESILASKLKQSEFHEFDENRGALINCDYLKRVVEDYSEFWVSPDEFFVCWCESDDYLLPNSISSRVKFLKENLDYPVVHTECSYAFEAGMFIERFWQEHRKTQPGGESGMPAGNIFDKLLLCNFIMSCTVMYRGGTFLKYFNFDKIKELGLSFGDYALFLSIARDNKIGYLSQPTAVYRVIPTSTSHLPENRNNIIRDTVRIQQLAREGKI